MADDFEALMDAIEKRLQENTVERTREATEQLLTDSRIVVPYQEGDLSRAGDAKTRSTGSGAEGTVRYDIVYARYQELREDLTHQDNGQAHYLGGTLRKNANRYIGHISKAVEDLG